MILRKTIMALLAIFLLAGAVQAPAFSESYESVFSDWANDGKVVMANDCYVDLSISNGSLEAHVSGPDHPAADVNIPAGQTYYYYNVLRIYVASVNDSRAYVSVDKFVSSSGTSSGTHVSCDIPGQTALGGDVVSFPLVIQNNDQSDHTYTLSSSSDVSWKTWFQYGDKGVYKVAVPATQSKTVNLMVQTWSNTAVGEKKVVASVDNIKLDVFVDITSANRSADVSTDVSSKIAHIGDQVSYGVSIKNLQASENHYDLSVTGLPENWYARYKESDAATEEIDEAVVPGTSTKSMVLEIVPPYSVAPGDYNFSAVVKGPDGLSMSKNLTLTLKSGGGMSVTTTKLAYNAKAGETFKIEMYVSNSGQGTSLTNAYVDVSAPDGWIVSCSPERVNSIKPGDTQDFTLSVQSPGNVVASDYEVSAKAKSDQAESDKDFRITIQTESYIPYIGGGIIVLVIIGLVVMYRKYGRR